MRNTHLDATVFNLNKGSLFFHVSDELCVGNIDFHAFLNDIIEATHPVDREHALYIVFRVEVSAGAAAYKIIIYRHVYIFKHRADNLAL